MLPQIPARYCMTQQTTAPTRPATLAEHVARAHRCGLTERRAKVQSLAVPGPLLSQAVRALVAAAFAVALAAPATASAQTRNVTFSYERPQQPRSLEPEPPITQQGLYPQSITVNYDEQAGRLHVQVRVFDPAPTRDLSDVDVLLLAACPEEMPSYTRDIGQLIDATLRYQVYRNSDGSVGEQDLLAAATRAGFNGTAHGTITATDYGWEATITNPGLAGVDADCALIRTGGESWDRYGYFAGYEPFVLTEDNAAREFRRLLGERYGRAFTGASKPWAICPDEEFFPLADHDDDGYYDDGTPAALCMAQFKAPGGQWRYVSVRLEEGEDGAVFATKPFTHTWTRKWRAMGSRCLKQAGVRGRVLSNDGSCPTRMLSDVASALKQSPKRKRIPYIGWYGTNLAGFEKVARFDCRRTGRTVRCQNGLGDAWRWTRPSNR